MSFPPAELVCADILSLAYNYNNCFLKVSPRVCFNIPVPILISFVNWANLAGKDLLIPKNYVDFFLLPAST